MATTSLSAHLPLRPSWDCGGCGRPWPCDLAREELAVEYRRHPLSLTAYMAAQYSAAVDDMWRSSGLPADLYERFLSWCNRRRRLAADYPGHPHPGTTERKRIEMDLDSATWVKSTKCDNSGPNCVEVARIGDKYVVRDSRKPGHFLELTTDEWSAFGAGVAIGEFRF